MDNKAIIGAAIIFFVLYQSTARKPNFYRLPDGRVVSEDELPTLGYVQYQGRWIHQSKLNSALDQNMSAWDWQNILNNAFSFGESAIDLWNQVQSLITQNQIDTLVTEPYMNQNSGYV